VRNAFIRIVNQAAGAEIARYDLTEDASAETAMLFGELYRNGPEWKFRAVGQDYASGLTVAIDYSKRAAPAPAPLSKSTLTKSSPSISASRPAGCRSI
jgi:hypothetical protein